MKPYEEDLMHRWTLHEIRVIEAWQRNRRWEWRMAKFRRSLPLIGLAIFAACAVGLAILLGVN